MGDMCVSLSEVKPGFKPMLTEVDKKHNNDGQVCNLEMPGVSPEDFAAFVNTVRNTPKVTEVKPLAAELGIKMISLPAGKFIYQGKAGVDFKGCKIAQTPFTNGHFKKLLELKREELLKIMPDAEERLQRSLAVSAEKTDELKLQSPMVIINQPDAEGIAILLGMRLLTEVEWERAAAYTDGRNYPFGSQFDKSKVTFNDKGTRSVFAHKDGASPEGVLDLSGNVWEWTSSNYNEKEKEIYKVLRGGSWSDYNPENLQAAIRYYNHPEYQFNVIGFRFAED